MTEQRNAPVELITACWKADALNACFLADPRALQAEHRIEALVHLCLKVAEKTDDTVHTSLFRASQSEDLSDCVDARDDWVQR